MTDGSVDNFCGRGFYQKLSKVIKRYQKLSKVIKPNIVKNL